MAHSFYAYLAPPIVVGELLTFKVSRDTEHKTTAFFQLYFQEKTHSYIRINTVIANYIWLWKYTQKIILSYFCIKWQSIK